MIALIKSFSLQRVGLSDSLGGNKIAGSFSLQFVSLVNSLGGCKIAGSFSLQNVALVNSLGGNKVASSFVLAKGGYTIDGVILPLELDDSKILRVK
ncbi:MAG: hypothetical protein MJ009_00450 [Paludibacteraceae bacterium]|nr:hypothetical protein [Paludibacteraceae bacterium]